jgi:hypothetical protein
MITAPATLFIGSQQMMDLTATFSPCLLALVGVAVGGFAVLFARMRGRRRPRLVSPSTFAMPCRPVAHAT